MDVRPVKPEEFAEAFGPLTVAFSFGVDEEWLERKRRLFEPGRLLAARENGDVVACAGAFSFALTVPGGEVPAAGITFVAVLPTHRRRGLLKALLQRQLGDARAGGEAVAILWASEGSIYGRFGFGLATLNCEIDLERDRAAFASPSEPAGRTRLLSREEAAAVLPEVYDRVRVGTPGMFSRSPSWWSAKVLVDPDYSGRQQVPIRWVVLELDGRPEAYAIYRFSPAWEHGAPAGTLQVVEAFGTSPLATREIWRFLLSVDLVRRIQARRLSPDHPLLLLLAEPARLRTRVGDGLWLRLVDVETALSARAYRGGGAVVLEVDDELCPWNAGRWRIAASGAGRTEEAAELRCSVAELGCAYLGGWSFAQLAAAGRVEEVVAGAIERADRLFRTDRAPWCPEVF